MPELAGRTILVIEDDALIAWEMETLLIEAGCRVIGPVSRVEAAVAVISAENLDAAVLDVNVDGALVFPAADALAAAGVPFMLVTGHGAHLVPPHHRHRPLINKPFCEERVLDTLAELIGAPSDRGCRGIG